MKKFKLKYIPGIRPVPMIAVFNDKNEEVFLEMKKNYNGSLIFNQEFLNDKIHLWNPFAYIIYDDNLCINSFIYESISHFFYLLRSLNNEMIFEVEANDLTTLKNELSDWMNEITILE